MYRNAAMEACDALDGVADGLISNQNVQRDASIRLTATLARRAGALPGGADTGDTCLSDAQITALNTINTATNFNFRWPAARRSYPGYNVWGADLGIGSNPSPLQPTVTFLASARRSRRNRPMPANAPYISVLTDQWIKYFVTRDPATFDSLSLDPENPGRGPAASAR
jgi:hypothetical protein